jgi:hypothetical protein
VVDGDLGARRFVAAYRGGDRLVGVVAVNMPPKALRAWRSAIAAGQAWGAAVGGRSPRPEGRTPTVCRWRADGVRRPYA